MNIYDLSVKTRKGEDFDLSSLKGRVSLVVNTATGCGFTPQYEAIEKYLYALDRNKFAYNRDFVTVYIPPHTNQKYFFDLGDTPEEIVKKIKRYYSSGVLYESSDDKETSYRGVDSLNESVTKIDSNKSKATTKDGREFNIWTETNDSHGGELICLPGYNHYQK